MYMKSRLLHQRAPVKRLCIPLSCCLYIRMLYLYGNGPCLLEGTRAPWVVPRSALFAQCYGAHSRDLVVSIGAFTTPCFFEHASPGQKVIIEHATTGHLLGQGPHHYLRQIGNYHSQAAQLVVTFLVYPLSLNWHSSLKRLIQMFRLWR